MFVCVKMFVGVMKKELYSKRTPMMKKNFIQKEPQ